MIKFHITTLVLLSTFLFGPTQVQAGTEGDSNQIELLSPDSLEAQTEKLDSVREELIRKREEQYNEMVKKSIEQSLQNTEHFVEQQNAQKRKQNTRLLIRGGILVILIISFIVRKSRN
ncbi:MAG: hypothetical protein JJ975_05320 [Bacteroidia bacterium]|nr:hypothetical protein [Bacteroidia bacterium]